MVTRLPRLSSDGIDSPFSATTLPPLPHPDESNVDNIISISQNKYANQRAGVEKAILDWYEGDKSQTSNPPASKSDLKPQGQFENKNRDRNKEKREEKREDKPFKKAFEKIGKDQDGGKDRHRENETVRPISLSKLESDRKKADPTPEKVSSLKEALGALLKKRPEKKNDRDGKIENKKENNFKKKEGHSEEKIQDQQSKKVELAVNKDVSSEDLKKIFAE